MALFISIVLVLGTALEATPTAPLPPWKGEYFQEKQGGLYVKMQTKGFKISAQTRFLTGNIQVVIYNILRRKSFTLSHKMAAIDGPPAEVWKLPSGKYEIKSIIMVDMAGVKRTWSAGSKTFVVKRQRLSNLGLWTITPSGKVELGVKFGMVPNSYLEGGKKTESSVAAVLNGFTGLIQARLAGKKLLTQAKANFSSERGIRAVVTFTRQIAMFYRLDMGRYNAYGKEIAAVLSVYDPNMRTCYTDRLEQNADLKGEVKFTFLLSKETGTIRNLKNTGGTIKDPKLVECMYYELAQIQFPVKENMIGELVYTYDVR